MPLSLGLGHGLCVASGVQNSGYTNTPSRTSALITEAAGGDRLEGIYVVAVHCGLRQGELLGLKWEDVEALQRHKVAQNAERLRLGGLWEDRDLVFPGERG